MTKPRILDPFDESTSCCHEWLCGKRSKFAIGDLSSLRDGTVPRYACPRCGREWARRKSRWMLVNER